MTDTAARGTDPHGVPQPSDEERLARVAWSRLAEPVDPVARRLIDGVGPVVALDAVRRHTSPVLDRFRGRLAELDPERDLSSGRRIGARVVCPGDDEWPEGLDDLPAPPYCLWVRGPAPLATVMRRSVAIVGARACTAYGEGVAADLAAGVAERGFAVVSGAAFGIDAAAHRGALAVDGCTVAVLAGGVERPYPAAHAALITQIAQVGAVVSEVPPGAAPTRVRFLFRNRLIATMTRGTVVVEAGLRSGSRNTAGTAAAHHRVVAAAPGPVTSMVSAGCHEMIRSGMAVLVTDAAEVAEVVGDVGGDGAPARRCNSVRVEDAVADEDRAVFEALPVRSTTAAERIAKTAGCSLAQTQAALGRLSMSGLAERVDGRWRRTRKAMNVLDLPSPP